MAPEKARRLGSPAQVTGWPHMGRRAVPFHEEVKTTVQTRCSCRGPHSLVNGHPFRGQQGSKTRVEYISSERGNVFQEDFCSFQFLCVERKKKVLSKKHFQSSLKYLSSGGRLQGSSLLNRKEGTPGGQWHYGKFLQKALKILGPLPIIYRYSLFLHSSQPFGGATESLKVICPRSHSK